VENSSATKHSVLENMCQHFDAKDRFGKPLMEDIAIILKVIFFTDIS
jgi:hypothetical protein